MRALLAPLAAIYGAAAAARSEAYRCGWLKAQRLRRPVISVGNLTTGGTGKTPLVAWIARLLQKQGIKPAILTRGYGRMRGPSLLAIDPTPGRSPDPRQVGDEPALLARILPGVPIVVSRDRWRAGRFAEERFEIGVHLLDDGFQYLRLARNLDIVTLDTTQDMNDRRILPAGRQRERCHALERAHIVVLTRTGQADARPLEARVRELNARAQLFHSRTKHCGYLEVASGRLLPADALHGRRVMAFCGIGNPAAFFCDLTGRGLDVRAAETFRDHHVYSDSDMARLVDCARKADATLVTTEKDVMNIPADWRGKLDAVACLIEVEVLDPGRFEKALIERL